MTDTRRVCDLSAAELLDAAWERLAAIGVTQGAWVIEVYEVDGHTRQLRPRIPGSSVAAVGRQRLGELGSAA